MAGRACAVVLAGGRGKRAGRPKQFARSGGVSLLVRSCAPFAQCREIGALVVVTPRAEVDRTRRELDRQGWALPLHVVAGGRTRHLSARAGLDAVPEGCDALLIHDAARPFVTTALIRRVLRAARRHGAAVPALPVHDSTVEVGADGRLSRYLAREKLRVVQTPQGFQLRVLKGAFNRTRRSDWTDDAGVVRAAGKTVALVEGDPRNQKVTTAEDLRAALARLKG